MKKTIQSFTRNVHQNRSPGFQKFTIEDKLVICSWRFYSFRHFDDFYVLNNKWGKKRSDFEHPVTYIIETDRQG